MNKTTEWYDWNTKLPVTRVRLETGQSVHLILKWNFLLLENNTMPCCIEPGTLIESYFDFEIDDYGNRVNIAFKRETVWMRYMR